MRAGPRVEAEPHMHHVRAGKAEDDCLPQCAQAGDAHPSGAVGVEVEIGGCGLAQVVDCQLRVA